MTNIWFVTLARPLVMVFVTLAIVAGCGGSPDTPPAPSTPSTSATSSTSAEWKSEYSDEELAIYREAVQRVAAYELKSQPIWAAGKATESAKEFFQENLLSWQATWLQLRSYDKRNIQVARRPEVLSTKAKSIKLLEDGAVSVVLTRCTDQTNLGGTLDGEPVPEAYDKPVIQEVDVYRYSDGRWRIGVFKTLEKTCTG